MMYVAYMHAENGAFGKLDFEADNNELAQDHLYQVASDPNMRSFFADPPEGKIHVQFRRHYAEVWHEVGTITPWEPTS